ncbi:MAG TPA: DNA gyrase inhibitor YacG [Myxococcaceae bacterium]|nr:DNA gyrase inhibitor YacG [Myxococcaceae bacterium]
MAAPCPICRRPAAPRAENPSAPFCSVRCRLVDLGRWLGEEYRVPEAPPEGERGPPAGGPAEEDAEGRR